MLESFGDTYLVIWDAKDVRSTMEATGTSMVLRKALVPFLGKISGEAPGLSNEHGNNRL